jgi:hypothetical protein
LTFGITCSSSATGLSDKVSVNVTENQTPVTSGGGPAPAGSGGGGGALNPLSLVLLAGILALRRVRIRIASRCWASCHQYQRLGNSRKPRRIRQHPLGSRKTKIILEPSPEPVIASRRGASVLARRRQSNQNLDHDAEAACSQK